MPDYRDFFAEIYSGLKILQRVFPNGFVRRRYFGICKIGSVGEELMWLAVDRRICDVVVVD